MGETGVSVDNPVEVSGMPLGKIKNIIEGALLAAGRPVKLEELESLFKEEERPDRNRLRQAIEALQEDYQERAMELRQVASGFRIQVRDNVTDWVSRLWEERPTRYSRALLETLALIAYRQPITRGEIEEVRGVSVSSSIVRTLQERGWIKVVGHRDVPGRPAMFGTTREFLDYFGLKSLDQLPTLAEIRDIDSINVELELESSDGDNGHAAPSGAEHSENDEVRHDEEAAESVEAESLADGDADDTAEEGIVDDAEQGDSVDERNLGQSAEEDPFEEGVYEAEEAGEELDFEEAHEQTQQEEGRQEGHLETEAEEAQGPGSETPAGEEDDEDERDERGQPGH